MKRRLLASTALSTTLAMAGAAYADDLDAINGLPAVSETNHKFAVAFGELNGDGLGVGLFSSTVPIAYQYGMQIDAMAATSDGDGHGGIAGHLFWRDPNVGLWGVYASYASIDTFTGTNIGRVALEGHYYWDRVSVAGYAGVDFGDIGTNFSGLLDFSFYHTDDFMLHAGVGQWNGDILGYFGVEMVPHFTGRSNVTLFADGIWSDDAQHTVFGGLRMYFGPDKSLIRRHREDDPPDDGTLDLLNGNGKASEAIEVAA